MFKNLMEKYNFFNVHQELVEATDPDERQRLENLLIIVLYTPYIFVSLILHLILMFTFQLYTISSYLLVVVLFVSTISLLSIIPKKGNEYFYSHFINLMISICSVSGYFAYHDYWEMAYWLLPLIIILPTILSLQYTTYYYTAVTIILLSAHLFVNEEMNLFKYHFAQNFTFIVIYSITIIKIYYLKLLQNQTIIHQQKQFNEISEQKEQIKDMYDAVIKSEEELRATNNKLLDYTQLLKEKTSDVDFYANYDPLTRLPNRNFMLKTLEKLIYDYDCEGENGFIFASFDLNDFKIINDTLGHDIGDQLLQIIADDLSDKVRDEDIFCRIGGDEFALIIPRTLSREDLKRDDLNKYFKQILEIFNDKIEVDTYAVSCQASVGVAIFPMHSLTIEGIIGAADTAMYNAKQDKLSAVSYFEEEMKNQIIKRVEREEMLDQALKNEQLFVEFQPLVISTDSKVVGFEALVRWTLPGQGVVPPYEFIDIAEKNGMIADITKFVLKQACLAIKNLKNIYRDNFYISVNLSPVQFINDDVVNEVKSVVIKYDINPNNIVLEITESAYINNKILASDIINQLRDFGFRIAIDDFGTGYSSIEQLIKVPCDIVKIDKAFVDIIDDRKDGNPAILRSIIDLAENLNMKVIAEGVETINQVNYLKNINCNIFQGYYFSRPVSLQTIITEIPQDKFM